MDRLTTHSHKTGSAVPSARLGDICLRINGCDDYDFCEGCPIREMLNKLCAYEDTGFTPEQIMILTKPKLSKSAWTGKIFKNEEPAKVLAEYNKDSFERSLNKLKEEILIYLDVEVNLPKNTAENIVKTIKDETRFFDNECLEEAIIHCRDVASDESTCIKCRDDHTQLAIWLEELKVRRKDNAG